MPKPKDKRNPDRAKNYVTQALDRLTELEEKTTLTGDAVGIEVSLRRNLESALADLTVPEDTPAATPEG